MSSPHVDDLVRALRWRGVEVQTEFPDGSKHVDICVPALRLFIEVDGSQHYTNADQFEADLKRDFYSYKEGYSTKRLSNDLVDHFCEEIADAIALLVSRHDTSSASHKESE
jgi:very-short-patch-repair endonuclease